MSDINVTPFIDVMLVLLIIFMVAAPLSTVDVSVELPVSNAEAQPQPDKPIFLTLKSDLSLTLAEDVINPTPCNRCSTGTPQVTAEPTNLPESRSRGRLRRTHESDEPAPPRLAISRLR